MKSVEKLILIVIGFLILSRVGVLLSDIYYAYSVGAAEPTVQQNLFSKNISLVIQAIINLGSSVWLYVESGKAEMKKWVWSLFGLFFGLMAVAIFYLSGIYNHIKSGENRGLQGKFLK